jgi:Restriction endonuclease
MASKKLPLSPMLFQYLVGLFTLKHGAGVNYHVTLGDEIPDEASGTRRDVDVTVATPDGEVYEFAGFEVKHWKKKLDVSHVEALAMKLKDMPSVTQRAIVCSSGYTDGAVKKAAHHGVDLYVIKEWTTPIEEQFPDLAPMKGPPSEVFRGSQFYLTWPEFHIQAHMENAPPMDLIPWRTTLYDADGKQHPVYADFRSFTEAMLVVSTDILYPTQPMKDRIAPMWEALISKGAIPMPDNPRWPFGHTFGTEKAEAYLRTSVPQMTSCTA